MKRPVVLSFSLLVLIVKLCNGFEDSACVKAPVPDFRAPGRRISEQRCYEYNFERKQVSKCSSSSNGNFEYPYMGALGFKGSKYSEYEFLCAAFLISPKFGLSSAHCIRSPYSNYLQTPPDILRLGTENILSKNVARLDAKISKVIDHPNFALMLYDFDISLVELESTLEWASTVQPACLWTKTDVTNGRKYVPSWGLGVDGNWQARKRRRQPAYENPEHLKVVIVDPSEPAQCQKSVSVLSPTFFMSYKDHHICAESVSETLLCHGVNFGAPIISKVFLDNNTEDEMPYAIGISSFGPVCLNEPRIGIYTRISSFIDWIEKIVWP